MIMDISNADNKTYIRCQYDLSAIMDTVIINRISINHIADICTPIFYPSVEVLTYTFSLLPIEYNFIENMDTCPCNEREETRMQAEMSEVKTIPIKGDFYGIKITRHVASQYEGWLAIDELRRMGCTDIQCDFDEYDALPKKRWND